MEYVILNEDRDTLERLTGGNVTDDVLAETHLWTRLFHADGNSGPLGTVALIAMLRQLGVPLNAAEPKAEPFDWSSLPQDGSVVVEAMCPERHEYAIGRFVGFVSMGTLAIKVGQFVLECAPINVRLKGQSEGGVTDTLSVATFAEEGPAPPAPETEVDPPVPEAFPIDTNEWLVVPAGRGVWVQDDDDTKDGEFLGIVDGGLKILVQDEEEPRVFSVDAVMLAD